MNNGQIINIEYIGSHRFNTNPITTEFVLNNVPEFADPKCVSCFFSLLLQAQPWKTVLPAPDR